MAEPIVIKPWGVHVAEKKRERLFWKKLSTKIIFLFISLIIGGYIFVQTNNSFLGITVFAMVLLGLLFRRRIFKKKIKKEWRRVKKIPTWASKRMKKKKLNKVYGKNYIYLRKGKKYYKKLK